VEEYAPSPGSPGDIKATRYVYVNYPSSQKWILDYFRIWQVFPRLTQEEFDDFTSP